MESKSCQGVGSWTAKPCCHILSFDGTTFVGWQNVNFPRRIVGVLPRGARRGEVDKIQKSLCTFRGDLVLRSTD